MRFTCPIPTYDLTYDDVFLVPSHSTLTSRMEADLSSPDPAGASVPVVAANMTAVSGKRMAETLARRGGLAVIPQDIPLDVVAGVVAFVKSRSALYDTALTLPMDATAGQALALLPKRNHGILVVTDESGTEVRGVVGSADCHGVDRFAQLSRVMSAHPLTISSTASAREAFDVLTDAHLSAAPVVDVDGHLVGVWTRKGALRSHLYAPNVDSAGRLRIGVALGVGPDAHERAEALYALGVDCLVVDTAHGHQAKMLSVLETVRAAVPETFPLVAGNVVTGDGVADLVAAGANIVKVGVGPGAMCTTRMMTGVGRPQFSAVLDTVATAQELGAFVWADGGIRHPRDVALALAAGASAVMIGSWFAATLESPGDLLSDSEGNTYKESYGMASARAVRARNVDADAFTLASRELFEEGISSSRMYVKDQQAGVEDLLDGICAGVRSAMSYSGARTLPEFAERAVVGVQSAAGFNEGRPLHRSW